MTIFFCLLETNDKGTALHQAIQQLAQTQPNPNTFAVEPESFQQVPGAPFAYWVSNEIRKCFEDWKPLEGECRQAEQGVATADDFRFIRTSWECVPVKPERLNFYPFAKGGSFSRFYADIYLTINWQFNGKGIATFPKAYIRNPDFYFRSGLTYPLRTNGLSVRILPAGCIFGHKGPSIFAEDDNSDDLLALCAVMNSCLFKILVSVQLARTELAQSFEVGLIQQTPVPDLTPESTHILATLARRACSLKSSLDIVTQTSHAFVLPALLQVNSSSLSACSLSRLANAWTDNVTAVESELTQIQTQIDDLVFDLYGISEGDRAGLNRSDVMSESATDTDSDDDEEDSSNAADLPSLTGELLA